jgi:hypothetical protein
LNINKNLNLHIAKNKSPISCAKEIFSIWISTHADSSYNRRRDKKYNQFPNIWDLIWLWWDLNWDIKITWKWN